MMILAWSNRKFGNLIKKFSLAAAAAAVAFDKEIWRDVIEKFRPVGGWLGGQRREGEEGRSFLNLWQ